MYLFNCLNIDSLIEAAPDEKKHALDLGRSVPSKQASLLLRRYLLIFKKAFLWLKTIDTALHDEMLSELV